MGKIIAFHEKHKEQKLSNNHAAQRNTHSLFAKEFDSLAARGSSVGRKQHHDDGQATCATRMVGVTDTNTTQHSAWRYGQSLAGVGVEGRALEHNTTRAKGNRKEE